VIEGVESRARQDPEPEAESQRHGPLLRERGGERDGPLPGERGGLISGLPRLPWAWALAGLVIAFVSCLVGVLAGPVHIAPLTVLQALAGGAVDPGQANILWSIRFPRVVLGLLVGGMLAIAGAAYQGVFRNALADPYLLGAAAGANLGATLAIAFAPGTTVIGVNIVPVAAFAGAGAAVAGAYALGSTVGGLRSSTGLILAGVAIAAFFNSIQMYVQQSQTGSIRQVYSWILGRLSTAGWDGVVLILPYVVFSVAIIFLHRRLLDALAISDSEVTNLGISVRRVRLIVVIAATLGTAAVVAVGGTIAFVGIIIPHTVRLLAGRSYRAVVPLSLLFGAGFLVLADTASRTLLAPAELPIGVITAFVGAPFFIVVMRSTRVAAL
jgi:iron complex transport system permease protein